MSLLRHARHREATGTTVVALRERLRLAYQGWRYCSTDWFLRWPGRKPDRETWWRFVFTAWWGVFDVDVELAVDVNLQALLLKQLSFGSVNLAAQGVHGDRRRSHVAGCLKYWMQHFLERVLCTCSSQFCPVKRASRRTAHMDGQRARVAPEGIWQRAASLHRCDGVPKGLIGRSHLRIASAETTVPPMG